jgi:hypothetical protein
MAEPVDLEQRLAALAMTLDRDLGFDERAAIVVDRVVQRLAATGPVNGSGAVVRVPRRLDRRGTFHRRGSRLALAAAVVVAILTASLVVSPRARRAVADLLGVRGVRIERVPPATTTISSAPGTAAVGTAAATTNEVPTTATTSTLPGPPASAGGLNALGLGERFETVAAAASNVSFPLSTLDSASAGPVVAAFVHRPPASGVVTIAYQRSGEPLILLSQLSATLDTGLFKKLGGSGTTIDSVEVNGSFGYWIAGVPHEIYYLDANGDLVIDDARLAGPTLLWNAGPVTFRIEGVGTKQDALALARTLLAAR